MTINTQVHLDGGTKSTDTMCEEQKQGKQSNKRRKISAAQKEKTQQARRELAALTKHLKALQEKRANDAKSEEEASAILALRPNALLTEHYLSTTGASKLKTFRQWKECGYSVKKNEKALRVWGKPFKATSNRTVTTPDGEHDIESSYEHYPMVPLYSNLQVQTSETVETKHKEIDQHVLSDDPAMPPKNENKTEKEKETLVSTLSNGATVSQPASEPLIEKERTPTQTTRQLLQAVKDSGQDFEWYPTTDEIIEAVNHDIEENCGSDNSILDCGAGDGRVLEKLSPRTKYAIEKAQPLLNAMPRNIYVVGTEFSEQVLIDKKVDIVFSNPPYSEFKKWAVKIINQANASHIYLVIPERWQGDHEIQHAIEKREAETSILGSYDFLNAERQARAKVNLVRIDLCWSGRYRHSRQKVTPFKLWFEDHFQLDIAKKEESKYDIFNRAKDKVKTSVSHSLVEGSDLISALQNIYQLELQALLSTYKKLETIPVELLKELNVNIESVRGALKAKIEGLKDIFWHELFNRLDKITDKLTQSSREKLLSNLTKHTHVDFTASNAYAVSVWVIKNANFYFDDQLIDMVERMTTQANIRLYTSNQRTFGEEAWRYGRTPEDLARYKLDYRIVLHRVGGLCNGTYSFEQTKSGLSDRAASFIDDLCTIATNIGFDTTYYSNAHSYQWTSNAKNTFFYRDHSTGKDVVLCEVRAFKNGNLHLKLNQAFICRLNVEFGRLKGWIKSAKEAAEELDISMEDAAKGFKSNFTLAHNNLLALGFESQRSGTAA